MTNRNRTDLALEAVRSLPKHGANISKRSINGIPLTEIELTENNLIGKPAGRYVTLHCHTRDEKTEINALVKIFSNFIPKKGRILVAGLGNSNITPDSLGSRTVSRVVATAHLSSSEDFHSLDMREVFVIEPGVAAQTGMESSEQLRIITEGVKPDIVIVVDSLACAETDRLGCTVQITDTGIAPGSGVGNIRREVSKKTVGVPVVAIGTPTVIDLSSIAPDATVEAMVVPRDIDNMINHFAKIISKALNRTLIPSLSENEIEKLRF